MTTDVLTRREIDVEDVEYLRHGVRKDPHSAASRECVETVIEYVHREMQ